MDARTFAVEHVLRNGTRVTVRAVRPDDRARLAAAFERLDRESVYTRFFGYKSELTDPELGRVASMDFVRELMLVATVHSAPDEIVVGSARYVSPDAPERAGAAEVAFTVEEDYQGLGLATCLLADLAAIAREYGIQRFHADVLPGNKAMLAVFAGSGLPLKQQRDEGVVHVTLALDAN
jgi:RimJ/RimL family protein N-acetyltransferase